MTCLGLWNLMSNETSKRHAVQFGHVFQDNLPGDFRRNGSEILFNYRARVGPSRIGMWKVRGPHVFVGTEEAIGDGTNGIVLKSRPELATYIFAGIEL